MQMTEPTTRTKQDETKGTHGLTSEELEAFAREAAKPGCTDVESCGCWKDYLLIVERIASAADRAATARAAKIAEGWCDDGHAAIQRDTATCIASAIRQSAPGGEGK